MDDDVQPVQGLTAPVEQEHALKTSFEAGEKTAKVERLAKVSTGHTNIFRAFPGIIGAQITTSSRIGDDIVSSLAEVDKYMSEFRGYIEAQKDSDKPLYQWGNKVTPRIPLEPIANF
jgi:hypothetical protein